MKQHRISTGWVIHLFAAAHAVATIILKNWLGVGDDIVLTLLTILMIIVVSRRFGMPIEVSAALAVLSCFAGFYLGTQGALILCRVADGNLVGYSNVITTIVITEILGWITFLISKRAARRIK